MFSKTSSMEKHEEEGVFLPEGADQEPVCFSYHRVPGRRGLEVKGQRGGVEVVTSPASLPPL